jgi:hypothetical protein
MTTVLFTALNQINKSVSITESLMTVNEKAARIQQLFEHDLTGATLLLDNEPLRQPEQEMKTTATAEKNETKEKKTEPKKPATKKEKKIIKKIFYSTTKGNELGTLSFISNNPLLGFWSGQEAAFHAGKAKPCLVRITYSLEDDLNMPGSFVLKRQESVPLDFEQRTGKSYEVMSGIKSLVFKYTLKTIKTGQEETKETTPGTQKQEPAKQQQKPKQPKEEITYTSNLPTWNSDEITQEDTKKEKSKEKKLPIPVFVDIEVTLWDETFEHEYTYAYAIEIIADTEFIVKQRQWAFMSLFQQPELEKEKVEQKTPPQQTPKTAIPSSGQKVGYVPWQQNSELQRKLDDLFKNVQALEKGIAS